MIQHYLRYLVTVHSATDILAARDLLLVFITAVQLEVSCADIASALLQPVLDLETDGDDGLVVITQIFSRRGTDNGCLFIIRLPDFLFISFSFNRSPVLIPVPRPAEVFHQFPVDRFFIKAFSVIVTTGPFHIDFMFLVIRVFQHF